MQGPTTLPVQVQHPPANPAAQSASAIFSQPTNTPARLHNKHSTAQCPTCESMRPKCGAAISYSAAQWSRLKLPAQKRSAEVARCGSEESGVRSSWAVATKGRVGACGTQAAALLNYASNQQGRLQANGRVCHPCAEQRTSATSTQTDRTHPATPRAAPGGVLRHAHPPNNSYSEPKPNRPDSSGDTSGGGSWW